MKTDRLTLIVTSLFAALVTFAQAQSSKEKIDYEAIESTTIIQADIVPVQLPIDLENIAGCSLEEAASRLVGGPLTLNFTRWGDSKTGKMRTVYLTHEQKNWQNWGKLRLVFRVESKRKVVLERLELDQFKPAPGAGSGTFSDELMRCLRINAEDVYVVVQPSLQPGSKNEKAHYYTLHYRHRFKGVKSITSPIAKDSVVDETRRKVWLENANPAGTLYIKFD